MMSTFNRNLFIFIIASLAAVPALPQNISTPSEKPERQTSKDSSQITHWRKIITLKRGRDCDVQIDEIALEESIETSIEKAMRAVEVTLEKMDIHLEPIEINLTDLNVNEDPDEVQEPDIDIEPIDIDQDVDINIEPVDIDLNNPDARTDIDANRHEWNGEENNDRQIKQDKSAGDKQKNKSDKQKNKSDKEKIKSDKEKEKMKGLKKIK